MEIKKVEQITEIELIDSKIGNVRLFLDYDSKIEDIDGSGVIHYFIPSKSELVDILELSDEEFNLCIEGFKLLRKEFNGRKTN